MPTLPQNHWPDTDLAKHYLLFAQASKTLLRDNAFESFRAPVLDNVTRLREFVRTCNLVLHRELPSGNLRPIKDELAQYLADDKVASSIIGDTFHVYIDRLKACNTSDFSDIDWMKNSSQLHLDRLNRFYDTRIQNELRTSLQDTRHKLQMQEIARLYISRTLNRGYDRRYIKLRLNDVFFGKDIGKVGPHLIDNFFQSFDGEERIFSVYIPIRVKEAKSLKNFTMFSDMLKRFVELPTGLRNIVQAGDGFSDTDLYFCQETKSLDCFSAVSKMKQLIKIFPSLTILEDRGLNVRPRSYAFVRPYKSRKYQTVLDQKVAMQPDMKNVSLSKGTSLSKNLTSILEHFDRPSQARILTALKAVSLARETDMSENQIILIWSAIETLFGDPPKGSTRLKYYRDCLVPIITVNYPWRYSKAVFSQVDIHARHGVEDILRLANIEASISKHRQFQFLLFSPSHKVLHKDFLQKLSHNPLLTHLVFKFYKRFGNPKALRRNISEHTDRVSWQIDRIYRARNEFIHAGDSSPFVDRLSINAFEYFRTCLQAILFHAYQLSDDYGPLRETSLEQVRESLAMCHSARAKGLATLSPEDANFEDSFLSVFRRM